MTRSRTPSQKTLTPTLATLALALCSCLVEATPVPRNDADKPTPSAIDAESCAFEAKYHCANTCITESATPTERPACEVKCRKRPLSDWDGTIPACTRDL